MIPYAELEKALARWKARARSGEPAPSEVDGAGSVPRGVDGLPPPSEHTGEIDLNDEAVESYEDSR